MYPLSRVMTSPIGCSPAIVWPGSVAPRCAAAAVAISAGNAAAAMTSPALRSTLRRVKSRRSSARSSAFRSTDMTLPNQLTPSRTRPRTSIDGEAVEHAGAAGGDQVRLAAAATRVRGVPRSVVATLFVHVAELHRAPAVGVAGVVAARVIHPVRVAAAVRLRACQDVVLVRCVADAVDGRVLVRQRDLLAQRITYPRLFDCVAME